MLDLVFHLSHYSRYTVFHFVHLFLFFPAFRPWTSFHLVPSWEIGQSLDWRVRESVVWSTFQSSDGPWNLLSSGIVPCTFSYYVLNSVISTCHNIVQNTHFMYRARQGSGQKSWLNGIAANESLVIWPARPSAANAKIQSCTSCSRAAMNKSSPPSPTPPSQPTSIITTTSTTTQVPPFERTFKDLSFEPISNEFGPDLPELSAIFWPPWGCRCLTTSPEWVNKMKVVAANGLQII